MSIIAKRLCNAMHKLWFTEHSYLSVSLVFMLSLKLIFCGPSCTLWRLGLSVLLRSHSGAVCVKGRASMKRIYEKWGRCRAQVKSLTQCIIVIAHITTCNWGVRCGQITEALWLSIERWMKMNRTTLVKTGYQVNHRRDAILCPLIKLSYSSWNTWWV